MISHIALIIENTIMPEKSEGMKKAIAFMLRKDKPRISSRTKPAAADLSGINIGDKMPDKTVYVGISPNTNKPMFAAPKDAPLTKTFNGAAGYAKQLNKKNYLGHNDWRVPTVEELDKLCQNKHKGCLKGSFNEETGFSIKTDFLTGDYWSSKPYCNTAAYCQNFINGKKGACSSDCHLPVRLIR